MQNKKFLCKNYSVLQTCLLTGGLCALLGFLSLLPTLIAYKGGFMYTGDYFYQYIPFLRETRRMLLSGDLSWSWNSFLGDNFIGAYSYYTAGNPFAWLTVLFPENLMFVGAGIMLIFKLAVAGVTSFLYVNMFAGKKASAIASVVYAFSGFTLVNLNFYFFTDIIAVLPLFFYGLELLINKRKSGLIIFPIAVLLNICINFYFFVSTCIIAVVYFVVRVRLWKKKNLPDNLKLLMRVIICGIIGLGLSAIILLPTIIKILSTPKAVSSLGSNISMMYYITHIVERLRAFFMPIESNVYHAFYDSPSYISLGMFLPVFGIVFALVYILRNKRNWISITSLIFSLILFLPFANGLFSLYSNEQYTRWLYILVMLFSVATAKTLDNYADIPRKTIKKVYWFCLAVVGMLSLPVILLYVLQINGVDCTSIKGISIIASWFNNEYFTGASGIALTMVMTSINYCALGIIVYRKKLDFKLTAILLSIVCISNSVIFIGLNSYLNSSNNKYTDKEYYKFADTSEINNDSLLYSYRIDYPDEIENFGMMHNYPSVSYYNSMQNSNSIDFAVESGYIDSADQTKLVMQDKNREVLDALLSVKYYLDYTNEGNIPNGFEYKETKGEVPVYENSNFINMGFTYDRYITEDELDDMDKSEVMLSSLVIDSNSEQKVSECLSKYDLSEKSGFNLSEESKQRNIESSYFFEGSSSGFTSKIVLENENYVFFSVPYDDNWNVTINNKNAEVIKANYGLTAVKCEKGDNEIVFEYSIPGLTAGTIISLVTLLIFIVLVIFLAKKESIVKSDNFEISKSL